MSLTTTVPSSAVPLSACGKSGKPLLVSADALTEALLALLSNPALPSHLPIDMPGLFSLLTETALVSAHLNFNNLNTLESGLRKIETLDNIPLLDLRLAKVDGRAPLILFAVNTAHSALKRHQDSETGLASSGTVTASSIATADIETLLATPSFLEASVAESRKELQAVIHKPSAKLGLINEWLHFRRIIKPHTDLSLGDCSYLNTCHRMEQCKYAHYELDEPGVEIDIERAVPVLPVGNPLPAQWIQCDVRKFDFSVLGKFAVIMADPPWDIHMNLPYGTMTDDEMRAMPISQLQDHGFIFLWVTGRAMELGRECLAIWGYKRVDELVWVKIMQLQKLIRTGRTGHWLNHSKEHCLIGVKGDPAVHNPGINCDVLVAEVRETSRKPDEVYGLIERLSPGTRKIEIFGRQHNARAGWTTLGNQLDGVRICEPDILERYHARYPV
ncbi:N6-adenosine-methyltransferase subunit mettl3 [Geranomyces michiganensis]|nr:N6-adenosine-methyltransferase subunit mettl3 [Geranomyces michiganensis]